MQTKPTLVQAIGWMTLASGVINILYGLTLTSSVVLGTLFLGIICAPVTLLPVVLGIFEVLYALKLLASTPEPLQPNRTLAILEIVDLLSLNVISALVGILALIFYDDPEVKQYFADLNSGTVTIRPENG